MRKLRVCFVIMFAILPIILASCDFLGKRDKSTLTELDTISYQDLLDKSFEYLLAQQQICRDTYKLDTYEHWNYDQGTGELTFSDSGKTKLIVKYQDVGSVSLKSNTWLWSWGNSTTEDLVKSDIERVKEFGEKRNFEKLLSRVWKADENDGWEMTNIAAYLLKAKGGYRVKINNDSLLQYFIFKEIIWADSLSATARKE